MSPLPPPAPIAPRPRRLCYRHQPIADAAKADALSESPRVIIRLRGEPVATLSRFRRGPLWRMGAVIVLALLAARPVWALGEAIVERYHDEIATVVRQTRAHLAWAGVPALEAVPPTPALPSAPASVHGGTGTSASTSVSTWGSRTSSGAASAMSPASAVTVSSFFPAMASRASADRAVPAHFAEHAMSNHASVAAAHTQAPSQTPAPSAARAQPAAVGGTFVWNAGAASTPSGTASISWTNGLNWNGGTAPAATANADIQFRNSYSGAATTSNVDTNYTIHSLTFLPTATVYTLTGSTGVSLTINEGGITQNSTNAQTLNVPVVLGAAQTWNVPAGAGTLAVNGVISGTNGFTKTGAGTLSLGGTAANTYSGLTSVTGGTLVLNKSNNALVVPGGLSVGNVTNPGAADSVVVRLGSQAVSNNVPSVNIPLTLYSDGLFDASNPASDEQVNLGDVTMTGGELRAGGNYVAFGNVTTNANATGALITATGSNVLQPTQPSTFSVARGTATYDLDVQANLNNSTLTKIGAGVLRLAGTSNLDFAVNLNAGTLAVAADGALGVTYDNETEGTPPSTFTLAGGTVVADGGDRTLPNPVTLNGNATIGASLDGTPRAITFTGDMTLNGSQTLTVNNTAATTFSGAVNLNGANTLTIGGTGNTLLSGVVGDGGGNGGLTKTGAGTLTLSGTNTYTGGTNVTAGTLVELNNGNALSTSTVIISSGATVALQSDSGQNIFQEGQGGQSNFYGAGTLAKTGAGTLTIGGNQDLVSIALSQGGLIDVQAGTLVGSSSFDGYYKYNLGSLHIAAGATFNGVEGQIIVDALTGAGTLAGGYQGSGSTTIGVANGSGTFSGVIEDNTGFGTLLLVKEGTGTETLTGANTYSGGTTFAGGIVNAGSAGAMGSAGTLSFQGGTLQYSAANQTDYSGRFSTANNQAVSIDTNGQSVTFASALTSNGGSLTKLGAGTLTLTGTNSYTGPTTVNAGILAINGVQTGTGMLSVASTATLAGTGSIAGAVQVQAGGTFSPGQLGAGRLTLQSSLTLTGAATASFTLGSTAGGGASTQALVGGQINLGTAATLSLALASGYTPTVGDKFFLLDETGANLVAGGFANAPLTGSLFTVNGVSFLIDYLDIDPNDPNHTLPNDVSVTVVAAVPEPSTCAWMLGGASLLGLTLLRRPRRPSALP